MKISTLFFSLFFFQSVFSQFSDIEMISNYYEGDINSIDFDQDGDLDLIGFDENIYLLENDGNSNFQKKVLTNTWTLNYCYKIKLGDLNNDNYPDIVCNYFGNSTRKITCFYNNGNNSLGNEIILQADIISLYPFLEIIDYDNDNDMDIITDRSFSNNLFVLKNNLTTTFTLDTVFLATKYIKSVDIDLDGDTDLFTGTVGSIGNPGNFQFRLNNGNGLFDSIISVNSVLIQVPNFVDIDGDNDIDIISNNHSWVNNSTVFKNNGNLQFILNSTLSYDSDSDLETKDINGDNFVDILITQDFGSSVNYFKYSLNNGNGNFGIFTNFNFSSPVSIAGYNKYQAIEDFNGDGFIEIITSELLYFKSISYLNFAVGKPLFSFKQGVITGNQTSIDNGVYAKNILADLNHDNIDDIIYTTRFGFNYQFGISDSTFSPFINTIDSLSGSPNLNQDMQIVDMNNDSILDVIVICPTTNYNITNIILYTNNGDSTFTKTILSTLNYVYKLKIVDIDNDGYLDIVYDASTLNVTNPIYWMKNLGNTNFTGSTVLYSNTNRYFKFIFNDLDLDNDPDIIASKSNGMNSEIFCVINNGSGVFDSTFTLISQTIGFKPYFLEVKDFNNDGLNDLIYCTQNSNSTNSLVLNLKNSSGQFNIHSNTFTSYLKYPTLNDFNHDGYIDISFIGPNNKFNILFEDSLNYFYNEYIVNEFIEIPISEIVFSKNCKYVFFGYEGLYRATNNFQNNFHSKLFVDNNSNSIFDFNDVPLKNKTLNVSPSNEIYFSNNNGMVYVPKLSSGLNTIIPQDIINFELSTNIPSYQFINSNFQDSNYYCEFAYLPSNIINDIELNFIGGFPRCNSTINYWLDIENIGTTYPNGIIELKLDSVLVLSSTSITPDSINGNIAYWSFDSLNYFESKQIQVSINTPGFLNIGDTMRSFLTVTVYDSLTNSSISFEDSLSQILVCAYDPNDKIVEPSGYSDEGYIKNDTEWLEYTVRFQNTGNDTAINVVILDQLDSNLDWNSLEILSSSDMLSAFVNNSGIITFAFNNIYLPDSTIDENGSHGFVNYKIKLNDNLSTGIKIFNGASIYFDYNPPIYTNYTLNTIYDCDDIVQLDFPENSCENTEINGSINIILDTLNTSWKINGVEYSTENEFNWIFDSSGIYSVEVLSNGNLCTIDSMKNITIFQKPSILISPIVNDTICQENLPINLPFVNPNGGLWISPYTSSNSYNPPNNIIGNQFLVYHFVDSNNCANKDSVSVFINQTPQVELIEFQFDTVCQNHFPYLLPNVTPLNGVWNSIDVSGGVFNPTTINIGNQELVYTFIDSNSCKNSDTLKLLIEECLSINELDNNIKIYPNPFNDKLYLENIPLDQYEIIIYDIAGNIKYYNTSNNTEENKLINLDFNSGFYFLKITTLNLNKEYIFKIVKI